MAKEDLYPNCDATVWMRSCEEEITEPLEGLSKGNIPSWLNGSLLRNGPGSLKVGESTFNHLFDSSALLHRFCIKNGTVTYQCRFLQTETYKKNHAAKRIVITEFGTKSVPDPCNNIFERVSSMFTPGENTSDNAMISVYPFGDEFFTFTESPVIFKIDPITLETKARVNLAKSSIGIINHTSHPHVMSDKTVYNLGQIVTRTGPNYVIVCYPPSGNMIQNAYVAAKVPARLKLNPSYMHSFGITKHFFIIIEQPLTVSVPAIISSQIKNKPLITCMRWFKDKQTYIYLLNRKTGTLHETFTAEAFFYLHVINSYEEDGHVVLDICCYKDPSMLNCMYVENMKKMQQNPDYARLFRGRPLRFVLPLTKTVTEPSSPQKNLSKLKRSLSENSSMRNISKAFCDINKSCYNMTSFDECTSAPRLPQKLEDNNRKMDSRLESIEEICEKNLCLLENSTAKAFKLKDGTVFCQPELLSSLGCETPRINYDRNVGEKYRYFYAISSDVDSHNPGTVIKVDTFNKTSITWCEDNCYPSEPVFVPSPQAKDEDDGVILSALVWGRDETNRVGLLCLCAKTLKELGRYEFQTPSPVPKCLHGWFADQIV